MKRPEVAEAQRLCSLKLPGSMTQISQNWHSMRKNSISEESVLLLYPKMIFLKLIWRRTRNNGLCAIWSYSKSLQSTMSQEFASDDIPSDALGRISSEHIFSELQSCATKVAFDLISTGSWAMLSSRLGGWIMSEKVTVEAPSSRALRPHTPVPHPISKMCAAAVSSGLFII